MNMEPSEVYIPFKAWFEKTLGTTYVATNDVHYTIWVAYYEGYNKGLSNSNSR